jgi:hypothetical protein
MERHGCFASCFFFATSLAEWEVAKIFQAFEGIESRDPLSLVLFILVMDSHHAGY